MNLGPTTKRLVKAVHVLVKPLLRMTPGFLVASRCNLCGGPVPARGEMPRCLVCLSTPRHRVVGEVLRRIGMADGWKVYELSHHGALFAYLRGRFGDGLTSSEYLGEGTRGRVIDGVRSEDVQALTFPDVSFDLVTSTEVFEHVPDDLAGMSEVARVLRPGGAFVFTVPIHAHPTTIVRARMHDGKVEHLLPPEYHGDSLGGDGSVLVFREYGSDLVDRFAATGLVGEVVTVDDPASVGPAVPVCVLRKPR